MPESRLAEIPGAEMARIKGDSPGRWLFKIEARRRGEVSWVNLSDVAGGDWAQEISYRGGTPDAVVSEANVNFIRKSNGRTLAPGITLEAFNQVASEFKPFLHPDTEIRVYAANLVKTDPDSAASYRPWFIHDLHVVEWPADTVSTLTRSLDARIEDAEIEEEEERGAPDPGTPVTSETQGLLNRWLEDPPTVYTPVSLAGIGIGPYKPAGKLGQQVRTNAQEAFAGDARYVWDNGTSAFRYTLYSPPRDKTTPDLYLTASQVREIPGLSETGEHIRTAFSITFTDEDGRIVRRNKTVTYPAGSPSYRRRWMGMVEGEKSPIKTVAQADAMLDFAAHDLSKPLAEMRLRIPFLPWIGLHDMIEIGPDFARFDISTQWSVVGFSHMVNATERYTDVEVRGGGPVGQFYAWQRRAASVPDEDPTSRNLYDFRREQQATGEVWSWQRGRTVHSVWAAVATFDLPEMPEHKDTLVAGREKLTTDSVFMPYPAAGRYTVAYVEPYDSLLRRGDPWIKPIIGTPPEIYPDVDFDESADGTETTVTVAMTDPRGVITGTDIYLTYPGAAETGPFAATPTAPLTWEYTYPLHPDHGVYVRGVHPRNDGGPAITWGPLLSDTDKIPAIPSVRKEQTGSNVTVLVDGLDTDTASLWYREDVGGVLGAETEIAPRGSDPRFGSFVVVAGGTARRFRIYGKNSAGEAGLYKDFGVDAYVPPPVVPEYLELLLEVLSSNATTVTVRATAQGATGADVTFLSTSGSATYASGPLPLVATPSPATWVFNRGAINAGVGQAMFAATKTGFESDTDTVAIEEQGRDTIPLQMRARVISATGTQIVVRVAVANAYPDALNDVTVVYASQGVASVSPASGQVVGGSNLTASLDTTWYMDFTVDLGTTPGRVTFTASTAGRLSDSDAVDPPAADRRNGVAEVLSANAAYEGGDAYVTTHHDPDTWTGTAAGQYRLDGGTPVTFDIDSAFVGRFNFPQSDTATIEVEIRGSTASGVWATEWFPLEADRYDPGPPTLISVTPFVQDTGSPGDDVYTALVNGRNMVGLTAGVSYYKGVGLRSTQTFAITSDTQALEWTDTGAGDGVSDQHYMVVQLYDAGTGATYGSITSRTVVSVI